MLTTAMYEVSSVGGNRLEAAAAIRAQAVPRQRPHETVKGHMMRFLRRSKSMAQRAVSTEDHHQNHTHKHKHYHATHHHHERREKDEKKDHKEYKDHKEHKDIKEHRHTTDVVQGQQIHPVSRNGMVVAIVDGLPFVVGAKNKNKVPR